MKRQGIAQLAHLAGKFGWDDAQMLAFLEEISGKEVA